MLAKATGTKSATHLDLSLVDAVNDVVRRLAVNGAADTLSGTKDLLDSGGKVLAERLESHGAGNVDDVVKRDVASVADVLLLLAVTRRLCRGK